MSQDVSDSLRMLTAPRRNNYFYGKRLDVPQFRMEQEYGRDKQWLCDRRVLDLVRTGRGAVPDQVTARLLGGGAETFGDTGYLKPRGEEARRLRALPGGGD